jgi:MFS transporter, SHS family, sialic acid transporter
MKDKSVVPYSRSPSPTQSDRLTRDQWMVLLAAFLGWLFDGFEIGLFPVVARPALQSMSEQSGDAWIGKWMGNITALFLLGAACGGLIFGWLGDRVGRVRAMTFSILTYSLFTGLGYFSQTPHQLGFFRFVAALGMGGEWSLGVALVMECWPERLRPLLAAAIGAAANIGFLLVGWVGSIFPVTPESWRWMFLIGGLPALLVFFIRLFVPESERWKVSVSRRVSSPLRDIFADGFMKNTLLAIAFSSIALIGTWGSVQWIPLWVDQITGGNMPHAKAVIQMVSAYGAITGCLLGPLIGGKIGRRPAFFGLCLGSLLVCAFLFRTLSEYNSLFIVTVFLAGCFTAAFYGWFPLYLPELFPTRMRATGQGVSYNFGRVFAAVGAVAGGQLVAFFDGSYAQAGALVTLVYAIGLILIWFAPETKGKPLPD